MVKNTEPAGEGEHSSPR